MAENLAGRVTVERDSGATTVDGALTVSGTTAVTGKLRSTAGLGVGNSAAATESIGKAVVKKIEVFAADGTTSLGFIPVYSSIT